MNNKSYWYEEGAYSYKAGIDLDDLDEHFPARKMTWREWQSLQSGWVAKQNEFIENMGQGRLF
ncbi:hypothetical protein ACFL1S_04840 [Pseudomonadota bacterium]